MLKLVNMDQSSFDNYICGAIEKVAKEFVQSGICKEEEGVDYANKVFKQHLPKGLATDNQFLFNVINELNEVVGMIWYGVNKPTEAFISDFIIDENYRGKGYGKETMKLVEDHARNNGIKKITLHVFGHNKQAINLYEKLGYQTFSMHMAKEL
ncbi:MAG TPA: GNAT family N-acetyltransferase [Haloplasmataceae bacterium]